MTPAPGMSEAAVHHLGTLVAWFAQLRPTQDVRAILLTADRIPPTQPVMIEPDAEADHRAIQVAAAGLALERRDHLTEVLWAGDTFVRAYRDRLPAGDPLPRDDPAATEALAIAYANAASDTPWLCYRAYGWADDGTFTWGGQSEWMTGDDPLMRAVRSAVRPWGEVPPVMAELAADPTMLRLIGVTL